MRAARNRRRSDPPAQAEEYSEPDIVHRSRDEQADWAYQILFGQGALDKDEASSRVVEALVALGLAAEEDAGEGSKVRAAVDRAIEAAFKQGRFDKPKRGQVRAILTDPKEYAPEDWMVCLTNALDHEPTEREAALRFAAYWAASNTGLVFARLQRGGAILTGLENALEVALASGRFVDAGNGCIRKV
jgi:hypothetical protein